MNEPKVGEEEVAEVMVCDNGKFCVYIPCGVEIAECHDQATADWICKQWNTRTSSPARQDEGRVWKALQALVMKLELIHADDLYKSVWTHYMIHGGVYKGPNYANELEAAKRVLSPARQVAAPVEEGQTAKIPWDMPIHDRFIYDLIAEKAPEDRGVVEALFKKHADLLFMAIEARDAAIARAILAEREAERLPSPTEEAVKSESEGE